MKIYIPTYKRTDSQVTIVNMPNKLKDLSYLVIKKEEHEELKKYHNKFVIVPDEIDNIGKTRQYIIDNSTDKTLLFLDDDLKFFKRLDNTTKLKPCEQNQFIELYNWFKEKLEQGFPMVGLSSQQGNHLHKGNEIQLSRIFSVYALNIEILKKFNIRFDEMELMEDFNVALRLIKNGFLTVINTQFAHGQKSSNAKGGCSEYRNLERQSKAARTLVKRHSPFVKLVKKKTKSWEGMQEREDVMIYWKKAYQQSI